MKWIEKQGIAHYTVPIPAHKKESDRIPNTSMAAVLNSIRDHEEFERPLLVHCNKGKHRTGCVMAAWRQWKHGHGRTHGEAVFDYMINAGEKWRTLDVSYLDNLFVDRTMDTPELQSLNVKRAVADTVGKMEEEVEKEIYERMQKEFK